MFSIVIAISSDWHHALVNRFGEDFLILWSHGEEFNVIVIPSMQTASIKKFNDGKDVQQLTAMMTEVKIC